MFITKCVEKYIQYLNIRYAKLIQCVSVCVYVCVCIVCRFISIILLIHSFKDHRCFVCTTQTSLEPNLSPLIKQIRIYRVDVEH